MKAFALAFLCIFVIVLVAVLRTVDAKAGQVYVCDAGSGTKAYRQKPCAYQDRTVDRFELSDAHSRPDNRPSPPTNLRTPPPVHLEHHGRKIQE